MTQTVKSTITCDMEGRIETFNAGAEALFGYAADEVIGKARISRFSPGLTVLQNVPGWLATAVSTGKWEGETVFVRKDGSRFPARIRITPTKRDGVQIGYCGVTEALPASELARVDPVIRPFTKAFAALVITRAPFLSASLIPVLVGAAYAAGLGAVNWPAFVLALVGAAAVHVAANTWNDLYDWRAGVDQANNDYFLPYSGGSRAIELGLVTEGGLMRIALGALVVALLAGLGIAAMGVPAILPLGLVGAAIAWTYTAPPLRLVARHGAGEFLIGAAFGPLITFGTTVAMTGGATIEAALVGIPVGLLTTAILWINEFPDAASDKATGKLNLVVTMGLARARYGYAALMAGAFGGTVTLIAAGIAPAAAAVALLTAPMALSATRRLFRDYEARSLVKSNSGTIALQGLFGLLFAIGVAIG